MQNFLSILDVNPAGLEKILTLAAKLKRERVKGMKAPTAHALNGKHVGLLFEKPSLRTRVTMTIGVRELGGDIVEIPADVMHADREPINDVARNLEGFVDAIMARTGPHEVVVELAARASIPVINGLTIREHPCQALADLFTLHERLGDLRGCVLAFVGDGNNVYHSLALMGATLGMEVRLAHPVGYGPNERIVARARELAATSGGRLVFTDDPHAAVEGATAIYTDAWTSMGQEAETEERLLLPERPIDPYSFGAVAILMSEGRPALAAKLDQVKRAEDLHLLARSQRLSVDPELSGVEELRAAIMDSAERRIAARRRAASTHSAPSGSCRPGVRAYGRFPRAPRARRTVPPSSQPRGCPGPRAPRQAHPACSPSVTRRPPPTSGSAASICGQPTRPASTSSLGRRSRRSPACLM